MTSGKTIWILSQTSFTDTLYIGIPAIYDDWEKALEDAEDRIKTIVEAEVYDEDDAAELFDKIDRDVLDAKRYPRTNFTLECTDHTNESRYWTVQVTSQVIY